MTPSPAPATSGRRTGSGSCRRCGSLEDGGDRSIGRVVTARDARGRGLSARLVQEAITLCAGHAVDIGAQTYLEGWYARFGFVRTGPDYDEDGVMHLPMRRDA